MFNKARSGKNELIGTEVLAHTRQRGGLFVCGIGKHLTGASVAFFWG